MTDDNRAGSTGTEGRRCGPGADRPHTFSDAQEFQNYPFQVKAKKQKKCLRIKKKEKNKSNNNI